MLKIKKSYYLPVLLFSIFIFWLVLTWGNYFHWDEWYFFSAFNQAPQNFLLHSYGEHFIPFNLLNHYILFKLFGLNNFPFQLSVILSHLINIYLLYKIVSLETKNVRLALFSALIFGISNVYIEDVIWSQGISSVGSALFVSFGYFSYLKYSQTKKKVFLLYSCLSLIISPLFNDFSILSPLAFLFIAAISRNLGKYKNLAVLAYALTSLLNLLILFYFSAQNIAKALPSFSIKNALQMIEFSYVGVIRGTVLRFVYPGLHLVKGAQELKIIFFVALSVVLFTFSAFVLYKWLKNSKERNEKIIKVLSLISLVLIGYIATSIGRSSYGLAQAGISRYAYQPFFFLVILGAFIIKDFRNKTIFIAALSIIWILNIYANIVFAFGFWHKMVSRDRGFAEDISYLLANNQKVYNFPTKGFFEVLKISDYWFLVPKDKKIDFVSPAKYSDSCNYCSDLKTKTIYKKFLNEYQKKFD